MDFFTQDLLPDITYKTSRSGGKGGQNVNKVSSKVELNFNLAASTVFNAVQKDRIRLKLASRIIGDQILQIICEEERSQLRNKERCLEKLVFLLRNALFVPSPRKPTKPKKSSVEARLKEKQVRALKKLSRRKDRFD